MEEIKKVAGKGDFVNKDDAKKQKETKKPKKSEKATEPQTLYQRRNPSIALNTHLTILTH